MTKIPTVAPWGAQKFEAVNTYAPKVHQPQALKHIDQNSTLDLGWDEVKFREKPKSMVEEMKDTLEKINGLLYDLGSRNKSTAHVTHEAGSTAEKRHLEKPMRDCTINSCIESLCDDITAATDQLKHERTKPDPQLIDTLYLQNERVIPKPESDVNHTKEPKPNEKISSRKSSTSTLDLRLSSVNNSLEISPSSHAEETETISPSSYLTVPKRKRLYSGRECQSVTCYYRGSEVSQIVSMHRSHFSGIADMCGYGESAPSNSTLQSLPGCRRSRSTIFKTTSVRDNQGVGLSFVEYPSQGGPGNTLGGVFEEATLSDDACRRILVL